MTEKASEKTTAGQMFWIVVGALVVLGWLDLPIAPSSVRTAYFLPRGHVGKDDYLPSFQMKYSADRSTQTVLTYDSDGAVRRNHCTVLSVDTWSCDGIGADDGIVSYAVFGQPPRNSVSWFKFVSAGE